jgi:hypothetical protein
VSTSPARFVIVLALVVVGVLVIANGFDASDVVASGELSPSPSATATGQGHQSDQGGGQQAGGSGAQGSGSQQQQATLDGLRVAVYNGTAVTGLGAQVQQQLDKANVIKTQEPANVVGETRVTTVFYRNAEDQASAELLARKFLPEGTKVLPMKGNYSDDQVDQPLSPDVQVAVFVGDDYNA